MRLSHQDGLAVDLLLDGSRVDPAAKLKAFVEPELTSRERVGAVGELLSVLDSLPAEEPSGDLVARTIKRVASDKSKITLPAEINAVSGQQPVA
jgi:hypothetical protein